MQVNILIKLINFGMMKMNAYIYIAVALIFSLMIVVGGCNKKDDCDCKGEMFGRPVENTGLSWEKCNPTCKCLNFTSKDFTFDEISALRTWSLSEPFDELTQNPYDFPVPQSEPCVCAVVVDDLASKTYHLENFANAEAAEAAGAYVTHTDACGLCSTLEDLAVYAENLDVGNPVRLCGLTTFNKPIDSLVACIELIGFSKPCAQIWAYNVVNTRDVCFEFCLNNDPYHLPDGSLSPCLACDENFSGPVFKAVAGRTRRNTGIASSICRFCDEVQPIKHNYPF